MPIWTFSCLLLLWIQPGGLVTPVRKEMLLLLNLSFFLPLSVPSPSSTVLIFSLMANIDCFYLVPNRWDVLGCSSWLARCSGSNRYLTCTNPGRAWLVHRFPEHQLLSMTCSAFKSAMTNAQNDQAHSWPLLTPPPSRGLWSQLCTCCSRCWDPPYLDPDLILLEQCQVVHKHKGCALKER